MTKSSPLIVIFTASEVKHAYYQWYKVHTFSRWLAPDATVTLIHSFITARLDYCYSLYVDFPARPIFTLLTPLSVFIVSFVRTATKQYRTFLVVVPRSAWNGLQLTLRLVTMVHCDSFYIHLNLSFQPCWGRERFLVVALR